MLLEHFEVDGQSLLDNCIVIFRNLPEIDSNRICLLELGQQGLLHLAVFLELSLLSKFS